MIHKNIFDNYGSFNTRTIHYLQLSIIGAKQFKFLMMSYFGHVQGVLIQRSRPPNWRRIQEHENDAADV